MRTILKLGISLSVFATLLSCETSVNKNEYLNTPFLYLGSENHEFSEPPVHVQKNVLLEDYTGHYCGYCPDASKIIKELLNTPKYADRLIPVSIYPTTAFNRFSPGADRFFYDFTTDEGDKLDAYYGVSSKNLPNGVVNRTEFESDLILGRSKWKNAIDDILEEPAIAWVDVHADYDNTDNKYLTISTRVKMLDSYPNLINVNVVLVEDHIINWQLDYSQDPKEVENYEHNFVLRYNNEAFNRNLFGTWGIELGSNNKNSDEVKQVTTTLNGTDWNVNNLYAVAYIYDATTKEVLQVNKTKVIQ